MPSLFHVTYNQFNLKQMKLRISITLVLTISTCLVMLGLLVYFHDHLWVTKILFVVNIYCRFFSISRIVNWVISNPLIYNGFKNRKFSHVVHLHVGLIMCLVLFKNRTHGFSMFPNPCKRFLFT